jgi:TetR/AcrR family transcriptional regulator
MKAMPATSAEDEDDPDSLRIARSAVAREKILDAALAEFAERGLAGARVDAIALRAGINKRFLYKYVGNKQALWLAVLERVYAGMREGERALNLEAAAPEQGMSLLIRFNFRFHAEHPEFLALLTEENRQRARNLRRSKGVQDLYSPLLQLIEGLLKRGEAGGVFRGGVDPMQLYISIAALSYFYCSNRHTLSTIFARDLGAAHEMMQREDHVVDVILGYLRPEPSLTLRGAGA